MAKFDAKLHPCRSAGALIKARARTAEESQQEQERRGGNFFHYSEHARRRDVGARQIGEIN
jgi:hypothetical protein